jgi:hypothetical protein
MPIGDPRGPAAAGSWPSRTPLPRSLAFWMSFPCSTATHGPREIAWSEATQSRYDLALAAGNSGDLYRLKASLLIIPHGLGYKSPFPTTSS